MNLGDADARLPVTVQYLVADSSIARRTAPTSTGPRTTWTIRTRSKTCGGGSSRCSADTRTS